MKDLKTGKYTVADLKEHGKKVTVQVSNYLMELTGKTKMELEKDLKETEERTKVCVKEGLKIGRQACIDYWKTVSSEALKEIFKQ